jgi:hypothetical protein
MPSKEALTMKAEIHCQYSGTPDKNKRSAPPAINAAILMRKFL